MYEFLEYDELRGLGAMRDDYGFYFKGFHKSRKKLKEITSIYWERKLNFG